jgi:hypothetical protein
VAVDRSRHGDDVGIPIGEIGKIARQGQRARGKRLAADLAGGIVATAERGHALRVDVETQGRYTASQRHGERQTDVAETDHGDPRLGQGQHCHVLVPTGFRACANHPLPPDAVKVA